MNNKNIILASASPRRKELLSLIFDDFSVIPSTADEVIPQGLDALKVAEHLAKLKAQDIAEQNKDSLVIGADTCVIIEKEILGKPKNTEDARRMITLLSGKTHLVVTGCCVIVNGKVESFSEVTEVEFLNLDESEIEDYIATNEPYDKAGAYGIQGKGALLVKKINGDYFNVVGLPVAKLNSYLKKYSGT